MLQLYEIGALNRSAEILKEAEDYRRWAGAHEAAERARTPISTVRRSAGLALAGLGKRLAGNG